MPKAAEDNYTWMKRWLQKITELGENVKDSAVTNDYGCYTALKLICVLYYCEVFSGVARKPERSREGFDGAVYVDLFAGSGLVKLSDTGDYVAGSPICAALNKNGFDHVVCVELDKDRAKALAERLGRILPLDQFSVIQDNCNSCIQDVVSLIEKKFDRPIVCAFVDPEGMEIKWGTLETLSKAFMSTDFIVNVSASGVLRVKGKLEKGDNSVAKSMSEYYDEDVQALLYDFATGKRPERKYQEKINNVLGKIMGDNIAIREQGNRIAYHILGYTRMTSGGSGYASAFPALKKRTEWADRDIVKDILDQIHGRTTPLF